MKDQQVNINAIDGIDGIFTECIDNILQEN